MKTKLQLLKKTQAIFVFIMLYNCCTFLACGGDGSSQETGEIIVDEKGRVIKSGEVIGTEEEYAANLLKQDPEYLNAQIGKASNINACVWMQKCTNHCSTCKNNNKLLYCNGWSVWQYTYPPSCNNKTSKNTNSTTSSKNYGSYITGCGLCDIKDETCKSVSVPGRIYTCDGKVWSVNNNSSSSAQAKNQATFLTGCGLCDIKGETCKSVSVPGRIYYCDGKYWRW